MARFHITNLPRSYQLSQQIWSFQQGSMDLATYYTKLKTLWDELDGANCVETCHNRNYCKATYIKADHAMVIKFLAGLNDSYAVIRSQIIVKRMLLIFLRSTTYWIKIIVRETSLLSTMPLHFM